MAAAKSFLIKYAAIYLVVGITLIVMLGPPGFSKDYTAKFGADHDRYLDVVKSDDYKLWKENSRLNEKPEGADFVAQYEARPEYVTETARRGRFDILFDFFNFFMVVYLMVHFGRGPLMAFLDGQIDIVKEKLDRVQKARAEAADRKTQATTTFDSLEGRKAEFLKDRDERIARDKRESEEQTRDLLAQVAAETEDRKHEEEHKAAMLVKKELVTQAIEALAQEIKANPSAEDNAVLLGQFIAQLEKRS